MTDNSPTSQIVEQVAEAIWRAALDPRHRDLRTWRRVVNKAYYRAQADDVIKALGLTEQWGSVVGYQEPCGHSSRKAAEANVAHFRDLCEKAGIDRGDHVVCRLVGPWRRVGGDG